ncbi:MAG: hypothetical protein CVV64_08700 [Candidatus Wallbacteria bacterium HGW-Wallbacteria-1]|jgi:hypothetical protein|uniref:KOW domain-containing protein n=1 Tax=Candidatus Wallbacteria bacterium HGW-Wallbacteria-1 TaxID=2013854 RepID=A0A2N1PQ28_9BACT|nr:MAG: hypothetical protein CVV64_08700 [Candidatus Wallbacteria bacterium HGW-Wallbacteria-1]
MGHAYTPGLKVVATEIVEKERRLPLKGEVQVKVGDIVTAEDVVACTSLPGNPEMINICNKLGIEAGEVPGCMLVNEGDLVKQDQMIAQSKGFFGFFKTPCNSPCDGAVELISSVTGQVTIRRPPVPVEIAAYIDGKVKEVMEGEGVVIESEASFIQGIFGIGGEVVGELMILCNNPDQILEESIVTDECKGKIVVGGSMITSAAVKKLVKVGAKGVIVGGIEDQDLKEFLGYDLGVAITGHEDLGVSIVVTEGFGEIKMASKTFALLKASAGKKTSINGATQIRAGVIRPEIIVPLKSHEHIRHLLKKEVEEAGVMKLGTPVRVIREPGFGRTARVSALPVELTQVESETWVRVVTLKFEDDGKEVTIPRANVEIIEQ